MDTFQKYPRFYCCNIRKSRVLFCPYEIPWGIKKSLSTNAALCVNSMIEKARSKFRWILSAACVLEINIYLQEENLRYAKWKNGVPSIRKCINNI